MLKLVGGPRSVLEVASEASPPTRFPKVQLEVRRRASGRRPNAAVGSARTQCVGGSDTHAMESFVEGIRQDNISEDAQRRYGAPRSLRKSLFRSAKAMEVPFTSERGVESVGALDALCFQLYTTAVAPRVIQMRVEWCATLFHLSVLS